MTTIVQTIGNVEFAGGVNTVTFAATPTPGNLLLALWAENDGTRATTPVGLNGWTRFLWRKNNDTTFLGNLQGYYRYAVAGDTKSYLGVTTVNGSNRVDGIFLEIASVAPSFSDALVGVVYNDVQSSFVISASGPTAVGSDLAITLYDAYTTFGAYTSPSGWTSLGVPGTFVNQYGVSFKNLNAGSIAVATPTWTFSGHPIIANFILTNVVVAPSGLTALDRSFPVALAWRAYPLDTNRTYPRA